MRLSRLVSLAFAVIPALHTVARQPGNASLADLALICIGLAAAFGLSYVLIAWALGPTWMASQYVLAGVLWFYGFPYFVRVTSEVASPWVAALAGGVITAAAMFWLRGRPETLDTVSRILVGTALLMVGWTGLRISVSVIQEHRAIASSTFLRELAKPVSRAAGAHGPAIKPSIYLLILDEYANSDALREQFGFDNHEFQDSLRHLGFRIPHQVRSNYMRTTLSLPSLLNFTHLSRLSEELGPTNEDPTLADYLVENNGPCGF